MPRCAVHRPVLTTPFFAQWNRATNRYTEKMTQKTRNAYMLVYERVCRRRPPTRHGGR